MPPSPTKYCLQELTDYTGFESLCHDLMALEGYPKIEPLGRFNDKGRDALHVDISGLVTVFAYSVREDWRAKLAEDIAKIKKHGHECGEVVFLCTTDFSANERDEAVNNVRDEYGWRLELYGLERLRVLLDSKHPHIKQNHPAIFPPAFLNSGATLPTETRDHLVIVNAEADRVFSDWLARKLTVEGYAVWCQSIQSLGDDRYPDDINKAIKSKTFRVLVIHSKSFFLSTNAVGLRALAMDVGKENKIDFVIPLALDPNQQITKDSVEADSLIQFGRSWAKGLNDLKKKLLALDCPRPRFDGPQVSHQYYDESEVLSGATEILYSNSFAVESIPQIIQRFQIPDDFSESEYENIWAFKKVSDRFVFSFFPPPNTLKIKSRDHIGADSWPDLTELTWSERGEKKKVLVTNVIPELIRKSVQVYCHEKGLKYCAETDLMYFPDGLVPRNRLLVQLPDGTKLPALAVYGERKYYRPDDQSTYYRYYLAPTFFVDSKLFRSERTEALNDFKSTVLYIRLRNRFTDTENVVLPPRTALSRRKHLCKSWWNDDWFRRTLAVAQFLGDQDGKIRIGKNHHEQIVINSFPNTFEISDGINEEALKTLGLVDDSLLDSTEPEEELDESV
jgi:TIR domain-containing protein